jgi:hypothetical protein
VLLNLFGLRFESAHRLLKRYVGEIMRRGRTALGLFHNNLFCCVAPVPIEVALRAVNKELALAADWNALKLVLTMSLPVS